MKLKLLLVILIIPLIPLLNSCIPSNVDTKTEVTLLAGPEFISSNTTAMQDSLLTFSIRATASLGLDYGGQIKSISASYKINNKPTVQIFDSAISITSRAEITFKHRLVGNVTDVVKYSFIALEENGLSDTITVDVTISPKPVSLKTISDQMVYNVLYFFNAPINAYDLNTAKGLTISDTTIRKDLMDRTVANGFGEGQFSKKWSSGNFTRYVKVTKADYINSKTTIDLFELWELNKNSSSAITDILSTGDIYLVRSGQDIPFNLYIVEITEVQDIPVLGNNDDFVRFSYKKIDN